MVYEYSCLLGIFAVYQHYLDTTDDFKHIRKNFHVITLINFRQHTPVY